MNRVIVSMMALLLSGCGDEARKKAEPQLSEAEIRELRAAYPGMTEDCLATIRRHGINAAPAGTDKCFHFTRPEHWVGLWRVGFEVSQFCPGNTTKCRFDVAPRMWLSSRDDSRAAWPSDGLYRVEFLGRRTLHPGHFGHMGLYEHEIIVDRMISIQKVPADKVEAERD